MKKYILIFCCFVCPSGALFAEEISRMREDWKVEARIAAFFPSNHLYREIYGKALPVYQIEASKTLCDHIGVWANFEFYTWDGKSVGKRDFTRINMVNFSFGARFTYLINYCNEMYFGIGPCIGNVWIKNHSHCIPKRASKAVWGGVAKLGLWHYFNECYFLDVFVDYSIQPVRFHRHVDLGGLRAGAGIGYSF